MGGTVDRLEPQDIPDDGSTVLVLVLGSIELGMRKFEWEHRTCALDALRLPAR